MRLGVLICVVAIVVMVVLFLAFQFFLSYRPRPM